MIRRLTIFIAAFGWFTFFTNVVTSLSAADVAVRLKDGRTLRGTLIAEQTNQEQIVLEQRATGIKIRRVLSRQQIASEPKLINSANVVRSGSPSQERDPRAAVDRGKNLSHRPEPCEPALPLAQLLVRADPVSTFGRADWDSLRLTLRGVDEQGNCVPLFGTLYVKLWGQQRVRPELNLVRHPFVTEANLGSRFLSGPSNSFAYQHPYVTSPNPTVELAKWTRSLGVESQGGALDSAVDERVRLANTWGSTGNWQDTRVGARQDGRRAQARDAEGHDSVFVLRIQRPLPDHDIGTGTTGEVTVELLMPGVGVFTGTAPDIALSHQNALRRERLDRDGSRFYPDELTTDETQTSRSRHRFIWPGGVSGPERGILPIQP